MITGVNSNDMNTRKYIVVVFVIADSLSDISAGIRTLIAWLTSWHQLRLVCLRSISSWESSNKPSVVNHLQHEAIQFLNLILTIQISYNLLFSEAINVLTRLTWLIHTSVLPSIWNPDKIFAPTGLLGQVHMVKKIFLKFLHAGAIFF